MKPLYDYNVLKKLIKEETITIICGNIGIVVYSNNNYKVVDAEDSGVIDTTILADNEKLIQFFYTQNKDRGKIRLVTKIEFYPSAGVGDPGPKGKDTNGLVVNNSRVPSIPPNWQSFKHLMDTCFDLIVETRNDAWKFVEEHQKAA